MRTFSYVIILGFTFFSCGLTSRYEDNQHSVFARLLTENDRNEIRTNGEIYKYVNSSDFAKSALRIIKTDKSDLFNFVEIGDWVINSSSQNRSGLINFQSIDSITYDSLGNALRRVIYDETKNGLQLTNMWTGSLEKDGFIQHMKVYENKILRTEYSRRVLNYLEPKSDLQKKKIPFGVEKGYLLDGTLGIVRTYDQNGKLINEEKYGR